MSILGDVGNLIDAIGQTAIGAANAKQAREQNAIDNAFRQQVYAETKAREDTAVQRRVADLAKAGLSPLSEVAGANASAGGSNIGVSSGQIDSSMFSGFRGIGESHERMKQIEADVQNTEADTFMKSLQAEKVKAETESIVKNSKLTDKQIESMTFENKRKALEDAVRQSVPERYAKYILAQWDSETFRNELTQATTKTKINELVQSTIDSACKVSGEVRRWIYFWK